MKKTILTLLTIPLLFTGCASIVDGGPKTVRINSHPEGAKVTIYDKAGKPVSVNTTPTTIALDRGGFYSSADYKLHFELAGYYPYDTHVASTLDGWYLANFFFGGLIGLVIVDPATGDMWTLAPRDLDCNLIALSETLTPEQLQAAQAKANPPKKYEAVSDTKGKH